MAAIKPAFSVKRVQVQNGPFSYSTYRVTGWIGSRRVRKQFNDANEAYGEKLRLEVEAANADQIRAVHTRLRPEEIADAEAAIRRLAGVSLTAAVDWYLANYRPPIDEKPLADAITAFLAEKLAYVSPKVGREYKRELGKLGKAFPVAMVHDLDPTKAQDYMQAFGLGKKGWNNLRGYLHSFFQWCTARPRCWTLHNPIHGIPKHKIARGIPEVLTAAKVAELFRFLETYSGGERQKAKAGCLVPYFALCTFAGIRPSFPDGEAWKLGKLPKLDRVLDLENGVIRIGPDVAKTRDLRQVTIQPVLRKWLQRYPLKEYPLIVTNAQAMITEVRKKFGLSHDVLRHTFISMYVAKFMSLGSAALEAGNSERIIKTHYLNLVTGAEAETFWKISPALSSA